MAEPESVGAERDSAESGYAPYGQLVKMLLPSAGSIAIYDAAGELVWCSDGYERPDLRVLLDTLRSTGVDTVAGRGSVKETAAGVPAFIAALTGEAAQPLGALVLELRSGQNARYSASMVASLLRPVLDCLESRLNLERTILAAEQPDDIGGLELLLSVDEDQREDLTAIERLLRHTAEHLDCVLGALLVPDRNLTISCSLGHAAEGSQLLDRTKKHLLAWAQLNNRPMIVNRVGAAGGVAPYKILSCPVRDPHDRVTGLIALFRRADAADFELRDVRILELVGRKTIGIMNSQYDALTGLMNRLIFERRMQSMLDSDGGEHALLYLDIDRLQAVNAAFGFQAGDEVIQRVAEVIRGALDARDLASRVAGDRFAVFMPHRDSAHASGVAERMLTALSQLGYTNGVEAMPVTASVGVAVTRGERERGPHLLACAELASKHAKQLGRNRLELYAERTGEAARAPRQLLASRNLQDALRGNHFELEAQPIKGLRAQPGETVGYEVLVRMRSPQGQLLAPDKFLEAAARYELMPAIDRWVVCSTIDILHRAAESLTPGPYFAINVSAQSLMSSSYASFVGEQLAQAGLPGSLFCFELNEAVAVNHLAAAETLVRELAALGCRVALDDFGCGLSSLAHLKRLPAHFLKIDGRFVRRVNDDRVAESIVSGIAKAAKTLGISTIAEHVETDALAAKLRDLEVDYGQGFHLGRPQTFAAPANVSARVRALTLG